MFTFSVMSYMSQNKTRRQTLESAQYGLEITFKSLMENIKPIYDHKLKETIATYSYSKPRLC